MSKTQRVVAGSLAVIAGLGVAMLAGGGAVAEERAAEPSRVKGKHGIIVVKRSISLDIGPGMFVGSALYSGGIDIGRAKEKRPPVDKSGDEPGKAVRKSAAKRAKRACKAAGPRRKARPVLIHHKPPKGKNFLIGKDRPIDGIYEVEGVEAPAGDKILARHLEFDRDRTIREGPWRWAITCKGAKEVRRMPNLG